MAGYSYNKVILIGNITRDLELRYIPSGTAVVNVGLAVNERFRSSDGERREKTCFIDVDVWGRQAETLCEYSGKGRCILIEGTLQFEQFTDRDGNKRSKHKVRCDKFTFLDPPGSGGGGGGGGGYDNQASGGGGGYNRQQSRPTQSGRPQQQQRPAPQQDDDQGGQDDTPFPPEPPGEDIPF